MRKTIERLISSLNDGDIDSLKDLFSDDVSFRDLNVWECSNGNDLIKALTEYLRMFPDFEAMVLDIEEMMGSFKVYIQTFGHMNDVMRKSIIDQGQSLPTDEELHPPAIWKFGFTDRRINLWNMDSISLSKKIKDIALSFSWAINTGKPENVISLITDSHTEGTNVEVEQGDRNHWIEAWEGYYRLFPDYRIYPENIHVRGDRVIILGRSDGTMSDYAKKTLKQKDGAPFTKEQLLGSSIWTAHIQDDLVDEWKLHWYNRETITDLGLSDYGYEPRA